MSTWTLRVRCLPGLSGIVWVLYGVLGMYKVLQCVIGETDCAEELE